MNDTDMGTTVWAEIAAVVSKPGEGFVPTSRRFQLEIDNLLNSLVGEGNTVVGVATQHTAALGEHFEMYFFSATVTFRKA